MSVSILQGKQGKNNNVSLAIFNILYYEQRKKLYPQIPTYSLDAYFNLINYWTHIDLNY